MVEKRVYLVAGLGNPGTEYAKTRHNAGFLVIDDIADGYSISLNREKFNAVYGRGIIDGVNTILAKPQSFMNRSGPPVRQLADYFRISHREILVVHDDIDLDFGRLKIKEKGGHGGHKGIRSIIDALGKDEFMRLRIGIGRSERDLDVSDHVLGRFGSNEIQMVRKIVERSRDAVVTILCEGAKEGMNRFNNKRIQISS
jgi:PTH1 family peptidyl-tRNA hydrolase